MPARKKRKPFVEKPPRERSENGNWRAERTEQRSIARVLEHHMRTASNVADEKARYVSFMESCGKTPEGIAKIMNGLLQSKDDRVRAKALDLDTRLRGWRDEAEDHRAPVIQINIGVPEVRAAPVKVRVVEAKSALRAVPPTDAKP